MRFLLLLITGIAFLAGFALASSGTISYQGLLTTASGTNVADGDYSVTFAIYNVPSGGFAAWFETQTVSTKSGLFNVQLGAVSTLDPANLSSNDCYLSIRVGSDPEISPRTPLASVPYAMRPATVDGASGGTITGNLTLKTTGAGTANLYGYTTHGGALDLLDEQSIAHTMLEPDADGAGGFFWVTSGSLGNGFQVDANRSGSAQPYVNIKGSTSSATFDLTKSGNSAVLLPNDAVSATEIFNEAGIAGNVSTGYVPLDGTMKDLVTVTVTTPTDGYILLTGSVQKLNLYNTPSYNYAYVQIAETAGAAPTAPYYAAVGTDSSLSTGWYFYAPTVQRVYFKTAGTYTFRLAACLFATAGGDATAENAVLTALFCPTSYGSVVTAVSSADAADFESATPIPASTSPAADLPGVSAASTDTYLVDLRELELKAVKARAEAEAAERALAEARLQEQLKGQPSNLRQ